jgi:hypothetical protein
VNEPKSTRDQRQAKAKRLQDEQRTKDRRRTQIIVGAIAVVAITVVAGLTFVVTHSTKQPIVSSQLIPSTPTGAVTVEATPKQVTPPAGITGLLAWDTQGWPGDGTAHSGALQHDHVPGPVTYAVLPPVGGPHNAIWMNAGVYTAPIPSERAVHNLEHGAVWITYSPALSADEVTQLTSLVNKQSLIAEQSQASLSQGQSNRYIDLSPWGGNTLPSPIVISSWGYQLRVTSPADPRLQQFIDTFRNSQKYSPEYGSPVDDIPVQTGGRAASDGGTAVNPPGSAS